MSFCLELPHIPDWLLNCFSIFTLSFTQPFFINHCPTLPTQVFIGKYKPSSQTKSSYFALCPQWCVPPLTFSHLAHTRRTQPFFLCVRLILFINVFMFLSSNHLFEKWINFFRPLNRPPQNVLSPSIVPTSNISVNFFLCGFKKYIYKKKTHIYK